MAKKVEPRREPPTRQDVDSWQRFADAILRREALVARLGRGGPPREFAGLYVDDAEVEVLLAELPGLNGPTADEASGVHSEFSHQIDAARAELAAELQAPGSPFFAVAWNAGLTLEETEIFALVAAVEIDPGRQRLVGYIQDNITLPRLALSTLRRLFSPAHPAARAVSPDSRLVQTSLVEVADDAPWATRMVSLSSAAAWALTGVFYLDPDLPARTRLVHSVTEGGGAGLVLVSGGDRTSRRSAGMEAAAGGAFLVTPFPATDQQWQALIRQAVLTGVSILVEVGGQLQTSDTAAAWIERSPMVTWVLSSSTEIPLESVPGRTWQEVRLDHTEATDSDWQSVLGLPSSGKHRLDRDQLRLVSVAYAASGEDLDAAVRRLASGHLENLARRIRPSRGWSDLILPGDQMSQLRELTARARHRDTVYEKWGFKAVPSAGIVALFGGPSGTGKTLSAEVIAGDLGLDVYKIDLSSVVSKYIGETEKNLERIFVAAGAGNMVLFFDEADSIFGKRSEVRDAHDRYANIEVSYLLQRIESYDGLVILATNLKSNIDEAFLRRIHVGIEFSIPETDERRAIWALSFPGGAPVAELDFDFLAQQFKIAGGTIRNAALYAAFLAAEADGMISMDTVILGLKREFQKLGRLQTEHEFDRYFELVSSQ